MRKARVLLGFAFGHRGQEPGLSNEDMGSYAVANWSEWAYHLLQYEIAQVVERFSFEPEHVVGKGEFGPWLHTQEIVHRYLNNLQSRGFDLSAIEYDVLCHLTHWSGCLWFLKKELAIRGVIDARITRLPVKVHYDWKSWQWQTRSPVHLAVPKVWRGIQSLWRRDISIRDVLRYFLGI